jgi:phosphohistidine phosphatase
MRLYLVRHGEANPKQEDPDRHLTRAGAAEVCKMAAFLKALDLEAAEVWHSTKTRARETAELVAKAIKPRPVLRERQDLSPNDPIAHVESEVAYAEEDLMIVGHMPFLGKLAAALLTGDDHAEMIAFAAAGVVCLERFEERHWAIRWMIVPELLAKCRRRARP